MKRRTVLIGLGASVVAGRQALPAAAPASTVEPEPETPCEFQERLRRNYLLAAHVWQLPSDIEHRDRRAVMLGRLHAREVRLLYAMEERGFPEPEISRIKRAARSAAREDYTTSLSYSCEGWHVDQPIRDRLLAKFM